VLWFGLQAWRTGVRLLRRQRYDVILAGSTLVVPMARLLGQLFHVPVVALVHGLDLVYPQPLYQGLVRAVLPTCARVIAVSQATGEAAQQRGVAPARLVIIPPGIVWAEFATVPDVQAVRQRYGLEGRLVLLSAGRLVRRKGVLEFIATALPSIVARYPETLFLVAGDHPHQALAHTEDLRGQIRETVQRLGLAPHVRLLGWLPRPELVQLYHSCDLFVLPALAVPGDMEGFGLVLLEANAAGKPVVATRLGGIPDAVQHGHSGMLVEAGDGPALARAIIDLLTDRRRRAQLGAAGRARVQAQFDWPLVAQRYVEVLTTLCP
jgi:glycosyltransferase involved in cell wall biosynthesis